MTVALAVASGSAGAAQEVRPEYQLKAAFVARFPEFTEWPETALDSRAALDICVARPSPFGGALTGILGGELLRGRRLQVREVTDTGEAASCLVLFIPAAASADRKSLLLAAAKAPVLTIGETPTFLDEGGIVNLRLIGGRVRFDINVGAAARVGLRFSSQLLRLALDVRGGPP